MKTGKPENNIPTQFQITVSDAAKLVGCSRSMIFHLRSTGVIKSWFSRGKELILDRREIEPLKGKVKGKPRRLDGAISLEIRLSSSQAEMLRDALNEHRGAEIRLRISNR